MGERLYSINEFLLSGFDEEEEIQEKPAPHQSLLTQNSSSTITTQKSDAETAVTPRSGNFHSSTHSIPRLSFQSAQSGADSDSIYTEDDSSLDGSCTFLEFLKEMEDTPFQTRKDDFNDFLYQVSELSIFILVVPLRVLTILKFFTGFIC